MIKSLVQRGRKQVTLDHVYKVTFIARAVIELVMIIYQHGR